MSEETYRLVSLAMGAAFLLFTAASMLGLTRWLKRHMEERDRVIVERVNRHYDEEEADLADGDEWKRGPVEADE